MIKNNKIKLLISSLIILLPMFFGLSVWDKLPDFLATHWGINGEADAYLNKVASVFLLPIILLVLFWFCIFITAKDPKNKNQNKKALNIVIFIIPIISCITNGLVYATAFDYEVDFKLFTALILGFMFIFIGNYMPKCKQNFTLGVKIKWTLQNEENWNATHRFTGKVWFISGVIILACTFIPLKLFLIILPFLIIPVAVLPILYSYLYYKKQLKNGTATANEAVFPKFYKGSGKIATIVIIVILIFITVIMFTGDINYNFGKDSFTIEADYNSDLTVNYEAIDNIEYRDSDNVGLKYNGFNSAKLLTGGYENDEFGKYTRYSYVKCDSCIVITSNENILVISGSDTEQTKNIYKELLSRIE